MRYSDKVVIVTGGSKGIGEGCVRVFVGAGLPAALPFRHALAGRGAGGRRTLRRLVLRCMRAPSLEVTVGTHFRL